MLRLGNEMIYLRWIASLGIAALICGCVNRTLPNDWPIPGLSLPSNSTITQVSRTKNPPDWTVTFNCELANTEVAEYFDSTLTELGFIDRFELSDSLGLSFMNDSRTMLVIFEDWTVGGHSAGGDYTFYVRDVTNALEFDVSRELPSMD